MKKWLDKEWERTPRWLRIFGVVLAYGYLAGVLFGWW